jgi:hypothetical protein
MSVIQPHGIHGPEIKLQLDFWAPGNLPESLAVEGFQHPQTTAV